jgi:hypothetical protein
VVMYKINIVWSWKKMSCSIIGDEAFWNMIFLHKGISKEEDPINRF